MSHAQPSSPHPFLSSAIIFTPAPSPQREVKHIPSDLQPFLHFQDSLIIECSCFCLSNYYLAVNQLLPSWSSLLLAIHSIY